MINPSVSVIIPIYKVEQYLAECVNSVLGQSYRNIEVILVDDGSPDSCPMMCDNYEIRDSRVRVIHKSNGGLSDARNAGLKIATGEYVVFLDSDDYWNSVDALVSLISVIDTYKNVDIIYFRMFAFSKDGSEISRQPEFELERVNGKSKEEVLDYLISNDRFISSACNKMVRREILECIIFEKGLLSEDIDWNFAIAIRAERLFAINNLFYAYRRRSGSITATATDRNIDNLLYVVEKWSSLIPQRCSDARLSSLLMSYCTYQLSICFGLIFSIGGKSRRKEFIQRARKLNFLWQYDAAGKVKKVKKIYRIFGTRLTGIILGLYLKIR